MEITENQLDVWVRTDSVLARGVIAGLLNRLVATSCPDAKTSRFPDEDSIGQPGSDGELETEDAVEPFVPAGRSFWEVGIGDPSKKATTDYKKATATIPSSIRAQSTFVFVTPRSAVSTWDATWDKGKQKRWLATRRSKREWKDIRILDGTVLVGWINSRPAVREWLMHRMNHPAAGAEAIDTHWENVCTIGQPPLLKPSLFLANRVAAIKKLESLFNRSLNKLQIGTRYPTQLKDFVAAYIISLGKENGRKILGRTLIVHDRETYNRAVNLLKSHVLILTFEVDETDRATFLQRALSKTHQVVYPGPIGGQFGEQPASLLNPTSQQTEDELVACGYPPERARKLAQKFGGNLNALLNLISDASELPQWSKTPDTHDLVIAEFIGSWRTDIQGDTDAIEAIAGKSFGEWIVAMQRIRRMPNAPLRQTDNIWKFLERFEGWYSLGKSVLQMQLDEFSKMAIYALKQTNESIDSDNLYAMSNYENKGLSNSVVFRVGISETIALLGSHPNAISGLEPEAVSEYARRIVRTILAEATWKRWATLNHIVPNLAEAAPSEFMNAIEWAVDNGLFTFLYANEGNGLVGTTHISGMLWGLESIAWDRQYFMRAIDILGQMAAIDPGGRFANRPASTLTHIFLPWLPQTTASSEQRVMALKILVKEHPEVARTLLISLLPNVVRSSSQTHRPNWRDSIPDDWEPSVTNNEYLEQTFAYTQILIDHVVESPMYTVDLVDKFNVLPKEGIEQILKSFISKTEVGSELRRKLWEEIGDFVRRHKRFSESDWAVGKDILTILESFLCLLEPENPMDKHRTLFGKRAWDYFEEKLSYEEQAKRMNILKEDAAIEIFKNGGISQVLAFAQSVEHSSMFGFAVGRAIPESIDCSIFQISENKINKSLEEFTAGFISGRFDRDGWKWFDQLDLTPFGNTQKGKILSQLPFIKDTWDRVESILETSEHFYWEKTGANGYHIGDMVNFAVNKLLMHSRPVDAVRILHHSYYSTKQLNTNLAIKAITAIVKMNEPLNGNLDTYDLREVVTQIQNDPTADEEAMIFIEWNLLGLLDRHSGASPKTLNRCLAKDPEFFCKILELAYRANSDKTPKKKAPKGKIASATNAYRLLDQWTLVPGTSEEGAFSPRKFIEWYEKMKSLSTKSDRLEVALLTFGHILRFAPSDPSGLWIHKVVAAVLNDKSAQRMRDGYRTGLFNARGVFWVDPSGQQEFQLAAAYKDKARALETEGFPRIAATLTDLASGYEAEANRRIRNERIKDE
jgi:hypothetical protein